MYDVVYFDRTSKSVVEKKERERESKRESKRKKKIEREEDDEYQIKIEKNRRTTNKPIACICID